MSNDTREEPQQLLADTGQPTFGDLIREPLAAVLRSAGGLGRAMAFPLPAMMVLFGLAISLGFSSPLVGLAAATGGGLEQLLTAAGSIVFFLARIGLLTLFAVSWSRRYLLGAERYQPPFLPVWDAGHWRFALALFLLYLLFDVIVPLFATLVVVGLGAKVVGQLYFFALPIGWILAWLLLAYFCLRLLLAHFALGLLLLVLWFLFSSIVVAPITAIGSGIGGFEAGIITSVAPALLLQFIVAAVVVAQICEAYRYASGLHSGDSLDTSPSMGDGGSER